VEVILVFPGQGSQKPGMARDLIDAFPEARAVIDDAAEALGDSHDGVRDLRMLMFEGPAEELMLTHNAQPALLAHGAAVWGVLHHRLAGVTQAAAGHSLGEFTAYHAAGALSVSDAVRLVRRRGELMYQAGVDRPGTMAAILGTLTRSADDLCRDASAAGLVVPANYNTEEQLVVSGEVAGVDRAVELATAAGAKRAMRLNVSGAFHSPLMVPAAKGLEEAIAAASWREPSFPVYSNVDAQPHRTSADARALLRRQLTEPVRWVQQVRTMVSHYPSALFVELGPGSVLTGLIKRIAPGTDAMACGTVAEVERLLARAGA
jgi:[acyl-carrier-protein] S-malonyltransferase